MEQHPIPRQITTFEFKLIGFMTLHQFLYLLVFVPTGFVVYKIIPIPFLNILFGAVFGVAGLLLAFLPVNDRPMDVFVKNLFKRLTSPTQYIYKKSSQQLAFLNNNQVGSDPRIAASHAEAQEKLTQYLQSKKSQASAATQNTSVVKKALTESVAEVAATKLPPVVVQTAVKSVEPSSETSPTVGAQQPFLIGVVKNNKEKPLPEILVYVKDQSNTPVRLLKTNPNGIFATYHSLPQGEYLMEAKDPRGSYLFDSLKIKLGDSNPTPITMQSKGLL